MSKQGRVYSNSDLVCDKKNLVCRKQNLVCYRKGLVCYKQGLVYAILIHSYDSLDLKKTILVPA